MPPAGFEPAVSASDRPQTLSLDRSATGDGRFEPAIPASDRSQTLARSPAIGLNSDFHGKSSIQQVEEFHQQTGLKFKEEISDVIRSI